MQRHRLAGSATERMLDAGHAPRPAFCPPQGSVRPGPRGRASDDHPRIPGKQPVRRGGSPAGAPSGRAAASPRRAASVRLRRVQAGSCAPGRGADGGGACRGRARAAPALQSGRGLSHPGQDRCRPVRHPARRGGRAHRSGLPLQRGHAAIRTAGHPVLHRRDPAGDRPAPGHAGGAYAAGAGVAADRRLRRGLGRVPNGAIASPARSR